MKLQIVESGNQIRNAFVEGSNSRLREERLNEHVFVSLGGARNRMEKWRIESNRERPHSRLGHLAAEEFAARNQRSSAIVRTAGQQTRRRPARSNALRPRIQNLIVFRPPLDHERRSQKLRKEK